MTYAPEVIITDESGNKALVNADGQLHIVAEGKIDVNNTLHASMAADEPFVGTATDIAAYAAITLLVGSDQDSAVDGLQVEFSPDGIEWFGGEKYSIFANSPDFLTPPCQSKYYRIKYTNGSTPATDVHIHPMLKKTAVKWSSHNIEENLDDGDDAQLMISVLKLRTAQDNYVTGAATAQGNFKVSLEEFEPSMGVLPQGVVSQSNGSTTPINDGANYTGAWEDVSPYGGFSVAVKTDQNGYYEVQFSPDGVNIDSILSKQYRTDQIEPPHRYTVTRQYARVVFYNNSGVNQTFFRLQVLLGMRNDLNIPQDAVIAQDYDSISVRPTDFLVEAATGRRQGVEVWQKWGSNSDVDTGGMETVWPTGGRITALTTPSTLDLVSTSANDTNASGTGARSVRITGVGADRRYLQETINLSGLTPVTTINSFLGVNRVEVMTAGSLLSNDGLITITATTGGSVQGSIPATEGVTQQAVYFVESDHLFLADWLHINITKLAPSTAPKVTVRGWVLSFERGVRYEVFRQDVDTSVENTVALNPEIPFIVSGSSMLEFTAETNTNDTIVNIRFSGKQIRNLDA